MDFETFQDALKHPIRRKIILTLTKTPKLTYMDLMNAVEAANTGKFNYHLKVLTDFIRKDQDGQYELTEKGKLAAQILQTFKEKKQEPSVMGIFDTLLIGFTGFVLTLGNPFFWTLMFLASTDLKSIPLFFGLEALMIIYGFFVPGALMWILTVRRHSSHRLYDIFKAPFFTFVMLLLVLIALLVFHIDIGSQIQIQTGPTITSGNITLPDGGSSSWTKSSYIFFPVNLIGLVFPGLHNCFLSVGLSELVSRGKKKLNEKR